MELPTSFKRGQTFSFMFEIPEAIEDGMLKEYIPTAQIRKKGNSGKLGHIGDINCYWADPDTNRLLVMYHNDTGAWPLGLAELDVLFTGTGGTSFRSNTVDFKIERGITV